MPGAAIEHQAEVLAVVKAINTVTLAIPEGMEISRLAVGSEVRAMYIEAVAMDIEAAPATSAKPAAPAAPAEKK